MNDNRADSFLRLIRRSQRGKLKIYLGYAAGVGKTCQMLEEAHRLKNDGIDVAVGFVETHGRAETAALLEGLEVIPRRKTLYRGIGMEEMDLDAVLARCASVVLVDELAHTNVPGCKNDKRYEDVDEILAAGSHVISTLNVQHLESLYETVERAVSVKVRERIPDRVVAEAEQLVNVDITSEDLRLRLKEGKIYSAQPRIETALTHFFQAANLEQLRELTLRELAAQIDARRRDLREEDAPSSPDQVMVALSSRGPNTEALLRYGSRLAGRLNRNWYAVYVQTARENPLVIDAATQRKLANSLTLAQQLGATVFTYKGDDVASTLLQFAAEYRVGHIVVGTPGRRLSLWRRLRGEVNIVERLTTEGRGITVVVLDTKGLPDDPTAAATRRVGSEGGDLLLQNDVGLPPDCVLFWKMAIGKEAAMRQLLNTCTCESKVQSEEIWEALRKREELGETFVGEEVALPHACVGGLKKPLIALGVARAGIFDRQHGHKAKLMILLVSPAEPPERHVELLGAISRIALDDPWRKELCAAQKRADVLRAIRRLKEQP